MKNIPVLLIAELIFTIICGCQTDESVNCTTEFVYGLGIVLKDSATGQPITKGSPVGIARDGTYTDTLHYWPQYDSTQAILLYGAGERAGRYSVRVDMEGFEPWARENIILTRDECHVHQQNITAFLKKK